MKKSLVTLTFDSYCRERRKFCCDADGCQKLFYTSQQLEVHRRTHSKSKPYSCQQCNKSFTTAGNLRNHMRSHTGSYLTPIPNTPKFTLLQICGKFSKFW